MAETIILIDQHIDYQQQGSYFTIPFDVPEDIETIEINYSYARRPNDLQQIENGIFNAMPEINIVDLGLIAPNGTQAGASGSDKTSIKISEIEATPGYKPCAITPGRWKIIVGAYKIDPQGAMVHYKVTLTEKSLRLLKGDTHLHSIASDGVHTLDELALKAKANGLNFLIITDHNQFVSKIELPCIAGVTMIPGVEWTHYQGHANFSGVDAPFDEPFFTNTFEEALERFKTARQRGALITVNHPFEGSSSFQFDMRSLPFDCLEIWNGPMRESNLKAVGLWQQLLASGLRIPAIGGSDYHRDTPFIFLGGPTMGVYALSNGDSDILSALKQGHSFITFAPNGPSAELKAGDAIMGDQVKWQADQELFVRVEGLLAGDVTRVATAERGEVVHTAAADGDLELRLPIEKPGFARLEVLRAFLPGIPMLPALLTNPIYFID